MPERWTAWGPAVTWAGVLFLLSALPGVDRDPFLFAGEDTVAHVLLYAVFGATLALGRARQARVRSSPVGSPTLLLVGFLYACSDEVHQGFVPGRDPSLGDLAADTLGLLLGYWLFSTLADRPALAEAPHSPPDP